MPEKPFEIDGWERADVKRAFYTMVNAPTWESARRALWTRSIRKSDELMKRVALKHSDVKHALCSGLGAKLMFMDATIMARNLADLNRLGIVGIPVHDSVIVEAKYESLGMEVMERNLGIVSVRDPVNYVAEEQQEKSIQVPSSVPRSVPHSGEVFAAPAGRLGVAWSVPPIPSWMVTLLPADMASLATVAWFYGAGEVQGYERTLQ
jgi:hypothetical protein